MTEALLLDSIAERANAIDALRKELLDGIDARIGVLDEERGKLTITRNEIAGTNGNATVKCTRTPRAASTGDESTPAATRGRQAGSGKRALEVAQVLLDADDNGLTVAEIADKIGVQKSSLYRVVPGVPGAVQDPETKRWTIKIEAVPEPAVEEALDALTSAAA